MSHTSTRIMHRLAMVLMTVTLTVLGGGISHNEAHQALVTGSTATRRLICRHLRPYAHRRPGRASRFLTA